MSTGSIHHRWPQGGALALLVAVACKAPATTGPLDVAVPSTPAPSAPPVTPAEPPVTAHTLRALLGPDGVSLTAPSGRRVAVPRLGSGGQDLEGVARSARALKGEEAALVDAASVSVDAAPETAYGDFIALLDALRRDAKGNLFPSPSFALPQARVKVSTRGAGTTVTPGALAEAPSPADDAPVIVMSRSALRVDQGPELVHVRSLAELAASGLPRESKAAGVDDLYIVPLARALDDARKNRPSAPPEAILALDTGVPYAVIAEILYTLEQSGFTRVHLLVLQKATAAPSR